jgi:hypothetical protein
MRYTFGAAALLAVLGASPALAQGTVSSQSFGYPPGQLSTRALGTAGALGDIDGRSAINPAALVLNPAPEVYAQYDPELRTVDGPGGKGTSTTSRFPNVGAALPVNNHFVLGFSVSTLLDRTWATEHQVTRQIGTDMAESTESLRSDGGIADLRFAAGFAVTSRFRIGLGLHGYTGSTNVTAKNIYADTLRYRNVTQTSELSYTGQAISAGFILDVLPHLSVAASARKGGKATMYVNDTVLTHANIPDRVSGTISFQGIPGTVVAIRGARERWSQMASLSTVNATVVDATDLSAGVESAGPHVGALPILFRAGIRSRTLPFPVGTETVHETSYGGGVGIPIAYNRVRLDISALRSSRTGVAGVSEHAYNLSFGLQIQP